MLQDGSLMLTGFNESVVITHEEFYMVGVKFCIGMSHGQGSNQIAQEL